jgi:hypothetical protein
VAAHHLGVGNEEEPPVAERRAESHRDVLDGLCFGGRGVARLLPGGMRATGATKRADSAARVARRAHGGSELHEGLVVIARMARRHEEGGLLLQPGAPCRRPGSWESVRRESTRATLPRGAATRSPTRSRRCRGGAVRCPGGPRSAAVRGNASRTIACGPREVAGRRVARPAHAARTSASLAAASASTLGKRARNRLQRGSHGHGRLLDHLGEPDRVNVAGLRRAGRGFREIPAPEEFRKRGVFPANQSGASSDEALRMRVLTVRAADRASAISTWVSLEERPDGPR